jgi:hypothetical protein
MRFISGAYSLVERVENASWPVSRVLSAEVTLCWMTIHLERLLPGASCNQPGRQAGNSLDAEASCHPYSVLLQVGFAWPKPVAKPAVRSYHTFSPLPGKPGGLFLWHFPWGCPRRTLSGTLIPWSPDFPPLSAFRHLKRAAIQPTGGSGVRRCQRGGQSSLEKPQLRTDVMTV